MKDVLRVAKLYEIRICISLVINKQTYAKAITEDAIADFTFRELNS